MKRQALQFALRELRGAFSAPPRIVVLLAIALVLGLAGPFQTFEELSFGPRLVYWAVIVAATYGAGTFASALVLGGETPPFRSWWTGGLATGFATGIAVSLVVLAINWLTFGTFDLRFFSVAETVFYCTAISLAVTLVYAYVEYGQGNAAQNEDTPKLLDRLPAEKRGPLISLSMQDHYVEVTTTRGSALVLLRFADAVAETGNTKGIQLHRSHWVALSGIARVKRADGKPVVVTKAGAELPVSRTYAATLKAEGF